MTKRRATFMKKKIKTKRHYDEWEPETPEEMELFDFGRKVRLFLMIVLALLCVFFRMSEEEK